MSDKRAGFRLAIISGVIVIFAAAQPLGQDPSKRVGPIRPITPQAVSVYPGGEIIEGTWILNILDAAGQTTTQGLITFNAGGGLTNDGIGANPTLRSPWHGTWARVSSRQFLYTQVRRSYDSAGNPTVLLRVRDRITVNATGDEYTGQGFIDTFDLSGNLTRTVTLSERAKRLAVEPVQ